MTITKKTILRWELVGIGVIFLVGALFHFIFEWSGYWKPVALLGAVNESTWEHLKLAFWPGLFYALVEYGVLRRGLHNFWIGKFLALLAMTVVISVLFYGYKAILGYSFFPFDLTIFLIAAIAGQMISYRLLTAGALGKPLCWGGIAGLVMLVSAFSLLTYFPPHLFLFEDPHAHTYGIFEAIRVGPGAEMDSSNSLICPSDFCYKPQLSEDVKYQCAKKASRSLDGFKKLTIEMTLAQVCGVVGAPDWETGSGLMIFVYDLQDGSRIFIGFGGPPYMVYLNRILPDGSFQVILSR